MFGAFLVLEFVFILSAEAVEFTSRRQSLIRHEQRRSFERDNRTSRGDDPNDFISLHSLPPVKACYDCCNDGQAYVDCLDVESCAKRGPEKGKYALVFSYVGKPASKMFPYLKSTKAAAHLANDADILMLLTKDDVAQTDADVKAALDQEGVQVVEVDWSVPPGMKFTKPENWCGQKDFIRLHALALENYDAVAYYDNDIEFQGDITPVMKCAASGKFLTTGGGIGEALNVGFFAARPDKRLLQVAEEFARESTFSVQQGWAQNGWKPGGGYYVGGECGQGFFHTLFYKKSAFVRKAMEGSVHEWSPQQIDKCIWNYQTSFQCKRDLDCDHVRVHHKPDRPGSDAKECLKTAYKKSHVAVGADGQLILHEAAGQPHSSQKKKKEKKQPAHKGVARYGFYFPVHDQIEGVVEVLKSTRKFYPEAPIYVLQDGGAVDFGPLCKQKQYNCTFVRATGENSRWNPHSWFARMLKATQSLGTEYVIYLEPDVKITRRHVTEPAHDAGGVFDNFNPTTSPQTKAYLERLGRERNPCFTLKWNHFGLCGGSYFRSEAILDAFKPESVKRIDWEGVESKEGNDKTFSSDYAMVVALSARGWTVYPWEESAQHFKDTPTDPVALSEFRTKWPASKPDAAFEHNHKELYQAAITKEELAAVGHFNHVLPDTTCHACIWFVDADPAARPEKVLSKPPKVDGIYKFDYVPKDKSEAKPCVEEAALQQEEAVSQAFFNVDLDSLVEHPDYILNAGSNGLPIAKGVRPSWLIKEDELVVDARKKASGGKLIVQPVFMEAGPLWGQEDRIVRPRWLRAILATNRRHAKKHGHAMLIRWLPSKPQLQGWQKKQCGDVAEKECTKRNERENFNWEKHTMVKEYLLSSQNFSHVLMLDADAALVNYSHDILAHMAGKLKSKKRDVFFTNEDWLKNGEHRINGGVILAKNTKFAQDLFQDTTDAHVKGPSGLKQWRVGIQDHQCSSNEQICLNDAISASDAVKSHILMESGISYNRGGCTVRKCGEPLSDNTMLDLGMKDPRLEVVHFMGDHTFADKVLCDGGVDYTGEGPHGYGCSSSKESLAELGVDVQIHEARFLCC